MPDENKSEKATPHKRREERKKGTAFQSKDLTTGIMIVASFSALRILGGYMFGRFQLVINNFINLGGSLYTVDDAFASVLLFELISNLLFLILPILFVAALLGILLSMAQTRIGFTVDLLKPKFSRINPIEGIKRMFKLKAFVELVKSLLKVAAIVTVLFVVISSRVEQIPNLLMLDVPAGVLWILETMYWAALFAGVAMIVIGILDFIYQWWEHERQMMMSKQEVKDEYKKLEGDPLIKAHRDQLRRQRARERMMNAVKDADVVVRNPEHFAVALKYDMQKNRSPVVVAKGRDFIAQRILREAEKHGVHTVEDRPLAQALYKTVAVDTEIPEPFWNAVSEIIFRVMTMKNQDLDKLSADLERSQHQRRVAQ